jgi:hypothetical protein
MTAACAVVTAAEEWRQVPSVSGLLASSLVRIRSEPYAVPMPKGGHRIRELAPTFGVWTGERFTVMFRRHTYRVAPLVCEAFHGPKADGQVCMHDDEDARNNRARNLLWGTQKQNLNYPGFLTYCRSRTGDRSSRAKSRAAPSSP